MTREKIEKIAKKLVAEGCVEVTSENRKHRVFRSPDKHFVFLFLNRKNGQVLAGFDSDEPSKHSSVVRANEFSFWGDK